MRNRMYTAVSGDNVFVTKDPDRYSLVNFLDRILPYFTDIDDHRLCLSYIEDIKAPYNEQVFHQEWLEWVPYVTYLDRFGDIFDWVEAHREKDCYFAPLLYSQDSRTKEYAQQGSVLWADLDACNPKWLGKYGEPLPNIIVFSSSDHWQSYWLLDEVISAEHIEQLNKNIVYGYRREGIDFGWSRTKIMRIPTTYNNKKDEPHKVDWCLYNRERASVSAFDCLPKAKSTSDVMRRVSFGKETITDIDADRLGAMGVSRRMIDFIKSGWYKGCGYKSRSELDMAVSCSLVAAGLNDDEIKAIFLKYPIGAKYRGERRHE